MARRNLCTNPKAGSGATTNWTNNSLVTFNTVAGAGMPTLSGLPAGVTSAFHAIGDANLDSTDFLTLPILNGEIWTLSLYARLVSLGGASRVEIVLIPSGTGTLTNPSGTTRLTVVGGNFVRLSIGFQATSNQNLGFRIRQVTTGNPEWHFTAVQFEKTSVPNVPTTYLDGSLAGDHWLGTAELSASAENVLIQAALAGASSLNAAMRRLRHFAAALSSESDAVANLDRMATLGADFSGQTYLSDQAVVRRFIRAQPSSESDMSVVANASKPIQANLTGESDSDGRLLRQRFLAANLRAESGGSALARRFGTGLAGVSDSETAHATATDRGE